MVNPGEGVQGAIGPSRPGEQDFELRDLLKIVF